MPRVKVSVREVPDQLVIVEGVGDPVGDAGDHCLRQMCRELRKGQEGTTDDGPSKDGN